MKNLRLSSLPFCCVLVESFDSVNHFLFRASDQIFRASSFLLSMASPFLHRMLCGSFRESVTRRVSLDEIDKKAFEEVLDLWCGKEVSSEKELGEVMALASLADRLQMEDVVAAL